MKRAGYTILLVVSLIGLGQGAVAQTYTFAPESKLWIEGTSTLHDWTCEATALTGTLQVPEGAEHLAAGVVASEVVVPVEGIDCHKGKMNDNLRKALRASEHPEVRYVLDRAQVVPGEAEGTVVLEVEGRLTVAGVEQPMPLRVTAEALAGGAFRLTGTTTFSMKQFDVKPPSVMLGTIKTGEDVTVRFEVVAVPASTL
ncbi:MAG: hypothetical protein KatS3mg044_0311 [Rhodothermaceae bacterium]|nr:MAG: hypothetical protein KatS3mg044_0311 [Rhodothermaceae bacterium]